MKTKYITYKNKDSNFIDMIVFSENETHSGVAKRMQIIPVSAGFIKVMASRDGDVYAECYGDSISLRLKSNPDEDSELANCMLGLEY